MKKWIYLFCLSISMILAVGSINAQNDFYIQKDEASGLDTDPYQASLNTVASTIPDLFWAWDSTFADSFKVFGFGFYKDLKIYNAYTYPDAFEDVKSEVSQESPYYLLIGRQTEQKGLFTKFFVDLKLPEHGAYACLDAESIETLRQVAETTINQAFQQSGGNPISYASAEIEGMETMANMLDKLVNCCTAQKSGSCDMSEDDIISVLDGLGYYNYNGLEVDILANGGNNPHGVCLADKDIVINLNSSCPLFQAGATQFNLTQELNALISDVQGLGGSTNIECLYIYEGNASEFSIIDLGIGGKEQAEKSAWDYEEHIVVLNFEGSTPKVYFKFDFGGGALKSGLSGYANRMVKWFFKRASTCPATVLIGVAVDYAVNGMVEWWFQSQEGDGYFDALWSVIKKRGVWGAALSIGENAVNAPFFTFLSALAMHFIENDPSNWNIAQALTSAAIGTLFQAFFSSGAPDKLMALTTDFLKTGGHKLALKMLGNKKIATTWEDLNDVFGNNMVISCIK